MHLRIPGDPEPEAAPVEAGVEDHLIQTACGWSSTAMVATYDRQRAPAVRTAASAKIMAKFSLRQEPSANEVDVMVSEQMLLGALPDFTSEKDD